MAIQQVLLTNYLDKMELKYEVKDTETIGALFTHKGEKIGMQINLHEDGELFQLETIALPPKFLDGKENTPEFFAQLLHYAWTTPFGGAELDKDGEVRFRVEIPIEDGTLTFKQFQRVLGSSLDATVMIRMLAKKIILGEEVETAAAAGDAGVKVMQMAMMAMMKARVILADPNAPEEAKTEARKVIESAKKVLPEEMLKVLLQGDEVRV